MAYNIIRTKILQSNKYCEEKNIYNFTILQSKREQTNNREKEERWQGEMAYAQSDSGKEQKYGIFSQCGTARRDGAVGSPE
jgi:hypothetical protein